MRGGGKGRKEGGGKGIKKIGQGQPDHTHKLEGKDLLSITGSACLGGRAHCERWEEAGKRRRKIELGEVAV